MVAGNLTNVDASETVNFNLNFKGLYTNFYFRFLTADLAGSVRTALITSVAFTIKPAPYDLDNDDLLDAWEQQIINANPGDGITDIAGVQPGDDYDGDGFNEEQEQYAWTVPTNSASYFKVQNVTVLPSQERAVLQWPSATNRNYSLYGITNLSSGNFSNLATGIPATPPLNTYTSATLSAGMHSFYIRIE